MISQICADAADYVRRCWVAHGHLTLAMVKRAKKLHRYCHGCYCQCKVEEGIKSMEVNK